MTETSYKARKGDLCTVELRHSSSYMHGRTESRSTWHVGIVGSATRDGLIKTAIVMLPESGKSFEHICREYDRGRGRGTGWAALTISSPIYREAAATLIGQEFETMDALRDAILRIQQCS